MGRAGFLRLNKESCKQFCWKKPGLNKSAYLVAIVILLDIWMMVILPLAGNYTIPPGGVGLEWYIVCLSSLLLAGVSLKSARLAGMPTRAVGYVSCGLALYSLAILGITKDAVDRATCYAYGRTDCR